MESLFYIRENYVLDYRSTNSHLSLHPFLDANVEVEHCLELVQMISTIPCGFSNVLNTCGRITVHSTGRFVLVSNRGHDSICVLSVEKYTGLLQVREIRQFNNNIGNEWNKYWPIFKNRDQHINTLVVLPRGIFNLILLVNG